MAKIAFLVGPEFEDSEFRVPFERLSAAGHQVVVLGAREGERLQGKRGKESITVQVAAASVDPARFDALVIPGGHSPDHLRVDQGVVGFVRRFASDGKLVAAVCHGPQLLIEAGVVDGRKLTSWPSVRTDLKNAGAFWEDEPVVEDGNFISSRNPGDLEPFSEAILRHLEDQKTNETPA